MAASASWQSIVASSLHWDQAHVTIDAALENLAEAHRGQQPAGYPHSVWQLLEHIRIAQHDLLDFCLNAEYSHDLKWPDDYWPTDPAPPSGGAWQSSLDEIRRDRGALEALMMEEGRDLTARIPHGTGQTYLRTVLVAADHSAYHVGQIVDVRRLLGSWPPDKPK